MEMERYTYTGSNAYKIIIIFFGITKLYVLYENVA